MHAFWDAVFTVLFSPDTCTWRLPQRWLCESIAILDVARQIHPYKQQKLHKKTAVHAKVEERHLNDCSILKTSV